MVDEENFDYDYLIALNYVENFHRIQIDEIEFAQNIQNPKR